MRPRVFVLLPVHNRRAITERFVQCLAAQTWTNYRLALIDDGSTDGTADMVRSSLADVTVLRGKGDWWWGGSLQQGVNWLRSVSPSSDDIVLIVNDDVTFQSDFIALGVEELARRTSTLLLAYCFDSRTGAFVGRGVHADLTQMTFTPPETPEEINCLSTRGLFVRWGDLQKIGDFHPRMLPHYLSDYEFTIRAGRKGLKLADCPNLKVSVDCEATGFHQFDGMARREFLTKLFSKKSADNPYYWSMFVLLACPPSAILKNLARLWVRAARKIVAHK